MQIIIAATSQDGCYEGWMKCSELPDGTSVFVRHSRKRLAVTLKRETKWRLRLLLFSIEFEQTLALFPPRERGCMGGREEVSVSASSDGCIMQLKTRMQHRQPQGCCEWHLSSSLRLSAEITTRMTGFHVSPNFPAYVVNRGLFSVHCAWWRHQESIRVLEICVNILHPKNVLSRPPGILTLCQKA